MRLFMTDQVHLYRKLTEQRSENTWAKVENLVCFACIVFAIFAVVATVIEVVSMPNNPLSDNSAYLYEPGDSKQLEQ